MDNTLTSSNYSSVPVLVLHGLTGTPQQFGTLKTFLEDHNIPCFVPHLIGHTITGDGDTSPKATEVRFQDIERELADYIKYLKKNPDDRIIIIGQSMGALLAIHLASQFPKDIQGLILLSPAVKLRKKLHNIFNMIVSFIPFFVTKRLGTLKKKWVTKKHQDEESGYPITFIKHLGALQRSTKHSLQTLHTEITVIQNREDYHLSLETPDIIKQYALHSKVTTHLGNWGSQHSIAHIPEVQDAILYAYQSYIKTDNIK